MKVVDLVYLWCSDADPQFRSALAQTRKSLLIDDESHLLDCRTDDRDELRFSLRSVEKYAPWIHHIFIVTNHQVPEWLDVNHPKITVIDHTQIIPKEYLPTFNSNVIEAFLHKIPGLSENFLLANDDMFFGNKTDPDFFFTPDGKPIQYIQQMKGYSDIYWEKILKKAKNLAENNTGRFLAFPAALPSHNIDPYTKSLYAETVDHFKADYQKMFPNKFRRNNDIERFLVTCWGTLTERVVLKNIFDDDNRLKLTYIDMVSKDILDNFFKKETPNLFCINNSNLLDKNDYQYQLELMKKKFPNKSSFEKDKFSPPEATKSPLTPWFSKNNIPIVFVINGNYLSPCAVAIQSLIDNVGSENNYDIIVLSWGIMLSLTKMLKDLSVPKNVHIRVFDITSFIKRRQRDVFKNLAPQKVIRWVKVELPEILDNYSKVIYLDADLLIHCDVAELWNVDMESKAIAGVLDTVTQDLDSTKQTRMQSAFNCDNIDHYINLGVMVMDLTTLRKKKIPERVFKKLPTLPQPMWNIYDIYNAILYRDIKLLPMTYNYQCAVSYKANQIYPFFKDDVYLEYQKLSNEGAKIVHFTAIKPWNKIMNGEGVNWWKTAAKTDFYEMILLAEPKVLLPKMPPKTQPNQVK